MSGNVRFIFDKRLEGEKYSEIAKMMNEKGIETPTAYLLKKGYSLYNTQWLREFLEHRSNLFLEDGHRILCSNLFFHFYGLS